MKELRTNTTCSSQDVVVSTVEFVLVLNDANLCHPFPTCCIHSKKIISRSRLLNRFVVPPTSSPLIRLYHVSSSLAYRS